MDKVKNNLEILWILQNQDWKILLKNFRKIEAGEAAIREGSMIIDELLIEYPQLTEEDCHSIRRRYFMGTLCGNTNEGYWMSNSVSKTVFANFNQNV